MSCLASYQVPELTFIFAAYDADDESHCQKIPGGGKSVYVSCGKSRNRIENLRISEVESCDNGVPVVSDNDEDQAIDDDDDDDDDNDDEAGGVKKIRSSVKQNFAELPLNATSFAYFTEQDCGSCGGSGETGNAILLRNSQCQSLDEDFQSFFYKVGDDVQSYNLKVYGLPNCEGPSSGMLTLTCNLPSSITSNVNSQNSTNGIL